MEIELFPFCTERREHVGDTESYYDIAKKGTCMLIVGPITKLITGFCLEWWL